MGSIDTIRRIPQAYHQLGRFRNIVHVLIKYGFGSMFDSFRTSLPRALKRVFMPWKKQVDDELVGQYTLPERLRMAFVELGPTFVKLGQLLAQRQDMIPPAFVTEFSKLQDKVPPFDMDGVRTLIREEFHNELEDFFMEFDEQPVGAASMAQGHRARLKDGTEVFVKLQRPGIARRIKLDLEILAHLARLLERHSAELGFLRPVKIIEEFAASMEQELDFTREMTNQLRFAHQFEGREGIHVPKIYEHYCTHRILTMEFVNGIKATDLERLKREGGDFVKLASLGANLVLEQFFEHGFFHGDPHPGNMIFLMPSTICYIDFGMMGRITMDERRQFADLLMHLVARDYKACAHTLVNLTDNDANPDMGELERDFNAFADQHLHRRLETLNVPSALHDLYQLCYKQRMFLKPHIYLMLKSIGMMDTLGRKLDPNFEIMEQIRPYAIRLMAERLSPKSMLRHLHAYSGDLEQMLEETPRNLHQLMRLLLSGRIHFNHTMDGVSNLSKVFDGVFNRLSSAIVLAAMLVGSSIVIHANPPPHVYGTSILGVVGYILSGICGIALLWDMAKHRG